MGFGGSVIAAISRQNVVDYYNERIGIARSEDAQGYISSEALTKLTKERTVFRKRRNQYFWGMVLLYVYSIMDGMVDAALSDFDSPEKFALTPGPEPMSLVLSYQF